jgi:hypothetical protein
MAALSRRLTAPGVTAFVRTVLGRTCRHRHFYNWGRSSAAPRAAGSSGSGWNTADEFATASSVEEDGFEPLGPGTTKLCDRRNHPILDPARFKQRNGDPEAGFWIGWVNGMVRPRSGQTIAPPARMQGLCLASPGQAVGSAEFHDAAGAGARVSLADATAFSLGRSLNARSRNPI